MDGRERVGRVWSKSNDNTLPLFSLMRSYLLLSSEYRLRSNTN